MGLFDEFARQVAKAAQAVAENTNPALAAGILEMLQQRGGLDALVRRFQEQGLGDIIASWVATGPNRPITPDDLAKVLDPEQLRELSRRAGIAMSRLPEALVGLVPAIVDHLTPEGEMPDPYRLLRMMATLFRGDRTPP
ncbi:MAG: hypothetical protein B6D46_09835 [Polyangiaceae bacterium UTPRO1]|jgi:uncharacterized protein YidB (DUF937 family)|nr:YidB family protein [Myxococcales bacterium]OQY66466.1 MAG: hypothetical protein B6D46_09835 [Polyangiaceae bacterium UTPRO1]